LFFSNSEKPAGCFDPLFVSTQAALLLKGGGCGVAVSPPHHTPLFSRMLSSYHCLIIFRGTPGDLLEGIQYMEMKKGKKFLGFGRLWLYNKEVIGVKVLTKT